MASTGAKRNRLVRLADMIEGVEARLRNLQEERDSLITDLMVDGAGTAVEIGKMAGVSQPRVSQIKSAVLIKRAADIAEQKRQARAEARKAARQAKRQKQLPKTDAEIDAEIQQEVAELLALTSVA